MTSQLDSHEQGMKSCQILTIIAYGRDTPISVSVVQFFIHAGQLPTKGEAYVSADFVCGVPLVRACQRGECETIVRKVHQQNTRKDGKYVLYKRW